MTVKQEATTSPDHGCAPEERHISDLLQTGMLVINKPKGPTSHMVAEYVKKILKVKKAGHGGTLDPGVTGVLPVALARSTRVSQALLLAGKEYVCLMQLHKEVPEKKIAARLKEYQGEITQLPPVRSAVKRQLRQRTVYKIELLDIQGRSVLFRMNCQAGTYVRKFVHDYGLPLGGAHMAQLIRTKAGPYLDTEMHTLQELEDAYQFYKEGDETMLREILLPLETAIAHLPKMWLLDSTIDSIAHGAKLHLPGIAKYDDNIIKDDMIALLSLKGELVALAKADTDSKGMAKEKGLAASPHTVFIQPGVYPKSTTAC